MPGQAYEFKCVFKAYSGSRMVGSYVPVPLLLFRVKMFDCKS